MWHSAQDGGLEAKVLCGMEGVPEGVAEGEGVDWGTAEESSGGGGGGWEPEPVSTAGVVMGGVAVTDVATAGETVMGEGMDGNMLPAKVLVGRVGDLVTTGGGGGVKIKEEGVEAPDEGSLSDNYKKKS